MGMFDSLYDDRGIEWQTKAYGCNLDRFKIGDEMPEHSGGGFYDSPVDALPDVYQVEVLGGPGDGLQSSWATVRDHVLVALPAERDRDLPSVDYSGGPAVERP